ncbi:MAG: hypothetical protein QOK33_2395, partial [Mycobacterium sp.]|nr:hypothetical protein [Mycobacterium sp.]
MTDQHRLVRARKTVANVAALGTLAFGAAVAFAATAAADPPPDPLPADPGPPPPPGPTVPLMGPLGPNGFNLLAQAGQDPVDGGLGAP